MSTLTVSRSSPSTQAPTPVPSRGYHHGNLRAELLATATTRARAGGASALVVREIAREVGVTPAAVYRHYPDAEHLVADVAQHARESLARGMIEARESVPRRRDPVARAVERFFAIGRAYIAFAQAEPGLFSVAFTECTATPNRPDDPSAWDVLINGLTELLEVGALEGPNTPDGPDGPGTPDTSDAAVVTWASVHGLATILARGALQPEFDVEHIIDQVLNGIARALGLPTP